MMWELYIDRGSVTCAIATVEFLTKGIVEEEARTLGRTLVLVMNSKKHAIAGTRLI